MPTSTAKKTQIRFLLNSVTDGSHKTKVWYSHSDQENEECIWVYTKNEDEDLSPIFQEEKNRVKISSCSVHWKSCKAAYNKKIEADCKRRKKRIALGCYESK